MTLNLSHLTDNARAQALLPAAQRIQHVNSDRWVGYPLVENILDQLQRLIDHPPCARMPCLLLCGESGIGKTMIVEKFSRGHKPSFDAAKGREIHPVVMLEMPDVPDVRGLYAAVMEELRAPMRERTPLWSLRQTARNLLRDVSVRMLFIDEMSNLLAGSYRDQRRSLNVMKSLANRAFLLALERELPLHKASQLADKECTQLLLHRSGGNTGRVCWILGQAAEEAIRSGSECITLALIDKVSERWRTLGH